VLGSVYGSLDLPSLQHFNWINKIKRVRFWNTRQHYIFYERKVGIIYVNITSITNTRKSSNALVNIMLDTHISVLYMFWSFGIIDSNTLMCWKMCWKLLSIAEAGARELEGCCIFYNPSFTDFIKRSLQFSCNFVVINASEGSLFSRSFNKYILPLKFYLRVCYLFLN
jgi:hypothetical protein